MRRDEYKELELSLTGAEPHFPKHELSQIEIVRSLNWYNYARDLKAAKKYTITYLKNNKTKPKIIKALQGLDDSKFITFGFVARMLDKGAKLPKKNMEWFSSRLKQMSKLDSDGAEDDESETKERKSIQDHIEEQVRKVCGFVEEKLDDGFKKEYKESFSALPIFIDNSVKGAQAKRIIEIYKQQRKELESALNKQDEQLVEGYSHFGKVMLKRAIAQIQIIIDDAQTLLLESKKNRKPRKRKQKTPEQLTQKLHYLKDYKDLNLISIPVTDIIGAGQLWVYNVKYKKLGHFIADDSSGLTVKGSTILNFNSMQSKCKRLRKPEQVLPRVLKAGKVDMRKILPEIKAKEQKLKGRLNKDTILVRVV